MSDEIIEDSRTIEQVVGERIADIRESCTDQLLEGKRFVREEPEKAIAYAVLAGYVLRLLPIGAIVRSAASLTLFAVKPLAVFYGVAKGYEILHRNRRS